MPRLLSTPFNCVSFWSATTEQGRLSIIIVWDGLLFGEAAQIPPIQPRFDNVGDSAADDARQTDAAALQAPVRSYVTQSSRGIWLFAPNQTGDGSNG